MKFSLTLFLSGSLIIVTAQETKKVTVNTESPYAKEVYYVLKENRAVRHGKYSKVTHGIVELRQQGQYTNNVKTGIWEYYSNNELDQKIDFSTRTVVFAIPFTPIVKSMLMDNGTERENTSGQTPVLLGGIGKFINCLQATVLYPAAARRAGVQGTVLISATVTRDGALINEKIEEGPGSGLNEEGLRVIQQLPNEWLPLTINGEVVESRITIAVKFKLDS